MAPQVDAGNAVRKRDPIWWSNAFFFVGMHLVALAGVWFRPIWTTSYLSLGLCTLSWQLAVFGITIGYHRLWAHKSFTARRSLRIALAVMGSLGFQGSIKWWCLRHRLHHRYCDDTEHDPYAATKGLYYSHMGWIFRRPRYTRMGLIDRSDLDNDPVVALQHRFFVPLSIGTGLVLPSLIASLWKDALGGLIWGGVIARLLIWHCTFIINSFAHWEGLQPYTDEVSARGNLMMALLTGGEGNHNFHAFPRDYRAGIRRFDWDPSKWIIELMYNHTSLVTSVRVTDEKDIALAMQMTSQKLHSPAAKGEDDTVAGLSSAESEDGLRTWSLEELQAHVEKERTALIVIDGQIVDVTDYATHHERTDGSSQLVWEDASWAFNGGMNVHSNVARSKMKQMRIGKLLLT